MASLWGVGAPVFVDRQAVQPVEVSRLEATQQLPQKTGVKLRVVGDHQDGTGLDQLEEAADGCAAPHTFSCEQLVSDTGEGDDFLWEFLAIRHPDERVHLVGNLYRISLRVFHAQRCELYDLVLFWVETAGFCIKDDESLVAGKQARKVTHGAPPFPELRAASRAGRIRLP